MNHINHLFQPQCYNIRNQLQEKKNCTKQKQIESKQYVTKKPMDQWRNQSGNKKIPRNKWQQKHNDSKPMGCSLAVLKRKFVAIQSYLRKQEKSQINNLT